MPKNCNHHYIQLFRQFGGIKKDEKKKNIRPVELLVIGGSIIILAVIVWAAADPARRFAEVRNAQRRAAVDSLLNAYLNYMLDNRGAEPVALDTAIYQLGESVSAENSPCPSGPSGSATTTRGIIDLKAPTGKYLSAVPYDPDALAGSEKTGFYIVRSGSGGITIGACLAEAINGVRPEISAKY